MWNPFARKKVPHPDGLDSTFYTPGIVFDGGAEHLAYINERPHPLLTPLAGFVVQRNISPVDRQVVYQFQAPAVMALLPGVQAGAIPSQQLLTSGQLSTSPNNNLLESNLFGAVQS